MCQLLPRPVWAAAAGGRPVGRLSQTTVAAPGRPWRRRCGSCRGTRSENEKGGGEAAEEAAPRPSRHLETYLTETWKSREQSAGEPTHTQVNEGTRADLCLVIGSWSEVKESELLYPSPSHGTKSIQKICSGLQPADLLKGEESY